MIKLFDLNLTCRLSYYDKRCRTHRAARGKLCCNRMNIDIVVGVLQLRAWFSVQVFLIRDACIMCLRLMVLLMLFHNCNELTSMFVAAEISQIPLSRFIN